MPKSGRLLGGERGFTTIESIAGRVIYQLYQLIYRGFLVPRLTRRDSVSERQERGLCRGASLGAKE